MWKTCFVAGWKNPVAPFNLGMAVILLGGGGDSGGADC